MPAACCSPRPAQCSVYTRVHMAGSVTPDTITTTLRLHTAAIQLLCPLAAVP